MRQRRTRQMALSLAAVLLMLATLDAQSRNRFTVQPESRLWIEGSSNVHTWTAEASRCR